MDPYSASLLHQTYLHCTASSIQGSTNKGLLEPATFTFWQPFFIFFIFFLHIQPIVAAGKLWLLADSYCQPKLVASKLFVYKAREYSLVPARFLTAQFLHKL